MKVGLLVAPNERSANPAKVARTAEMLGFESLWVPDRWVMPVHTATPLPETRPGEGGIPEIYYHMCDPLVAMAMATAATTRLMVATGVLLVPRAQPAAYRQRTGNADRLSGGRVILGIGAGSLARSSEILGVDFAHRWTRRGSTSPRSRAVDQRRCLVQRPLHKIPACPMLSQARAQRRPADYHRQQGQKCAALGRAMGQQGDVRRFS